MPQPVDPNTEIMRITAAERIQQIADRASLAAQARQAEDVAEQRVDDESQVSKSDQKGEQVEKELRRHNPFMGRRRRRAAEEKAAAEAADRLAEPPSPPVATEHHTLDISI